MSIKFSTVNIVVTACTNLFERNCSLALANKLQLVFVMVKYFPFNVFSVHY